MTVVSAGVIGGVCLLRTELLCPQNSSVEGPTPSVIAYGGEPLGWGLGFRGLPGKALMTALRSS